MGTVKSGFLHLSVNYLEEVDHDFCCLLPQILQTVRAPGQRQAAGIEVSLLWLVNMRLDSQLNL